MPKWRPSGDIDYKLVAGLRWALLVDDEKMQAIIHATSITPTGARDAPVAGRADWWCTRDQHSAPRRREGCDGQQVVVGMVTHRVLVCMLLPYGDAARRARRCGHWLQLGDGWRASGSKLVGCAGRNANPMHAFL